MAVIRKTLTAAKIQCQIAKRAIHFTFRKGFHLHATVIVTEVQCAYEILPVNIEIIYYVTEDTELPLCRKYNTISPLICLYKELTVKTVFWDSPKSLQMVTAAMKLKDAYSLEEKL